MKIISVYLKCSDRRGKFSNNFLEDLDKIASLSALNY